MTVLSINERVFWTNLLLISAALALWTTSSHAASLLNLRIADHETYTRVVFEFNSELTSKPAIQSTDNELTILFPGAQPEFNRKIPSNRSKRVAGIEFWQKKEGLSAILRLNAKGFRQQSVALSNPFRIVIDLFPSAMPETPHADVSSGEKKETETEPALPLPRILPEPLNGQQNLTADQAAIINSAALPTEKSKSIDTPPLVQPAETKTDKEVQRLDSAPSRMVTGEEQADIVPPVPDSRLQFYLIMALVVLTVLILFLLTLMLLTRHRWVEDLKNPGRSRGDGTDAFREPHKRDVAPFSTIGQKRLNNIDEA